MGQVIVPGAKGITVNPTDRESGPGAGAGASGNNSIFLGLNAGLNSTASNLIVLGNNSGDAGIGNTINGTIILGVASGQALTTNTISGAGPQAVILIGNGTMAAAPNVDSTIAIGQQIFQASTGTSFQGNVLIGNGIGQTAAFAYVATSVIIGHRALGSNPGSSTNNVVIGYKAMNGNTGGPVDNVFIGQSVALTVGSTGLSGGSQNVVIGSQADLSANTGGNVVIGFLAQAPGVSAAAGSCIGIGRASVCAGNLDAVGYNVVIGATATIPTNTATGRCVIIGGGAGKTLPLASADVLVIETNVSSQTALVYGVFTTGNMVLGNSTDAANRDTGGLGATNILKLINGTVGASNPVGGGYFYVSAGALHWKGSAGTDTPLAPA